VTRPSFVLAFWTHGERHARAIHAWSGR
jgi:hypothetical protein